MLQARASSILRQVHKILIFKHYCVKGLGSDLNLKEKTVLPRATPQNTRCEWTHLCCFR